MPGKKKKDDLITIVSSEEKEIPERRPPYELILYDYVPESEETVVARKNDHVAQAVEEEKGNTGPKNENGTKTNNTKKEKARLKMFQTFNEVYEKNEKKKKKKG